MRTLHRALYALLVASTALAGITAAAGCETDDSSTPLPPAVTDATTDRAASDGAAAGDAASDGASPVESSTDAPTEGSSDASGSGG
jgi:hypothetical protein